MAKIYFSKKAEKELAKLPRTAKKKIIRKIEVLKKEPISGKKLAGKLKNLFSLKAWPYRIIYEFEKGNVYVVIIEHRQQVYKN